MNESRRCFLGLLGVGGALVTAGGGSLLYHTAKTESYDLRQWLVSVTESNDFFMNVGSAMTASGKDVFAVFLARLDLPYRAKKSPDEFIRTVKDRIEEDYFEGNLVVLEGWILAEIEVLFCACLALVGQG